MEEGGGRKRWMAGEVRSEWEGCRREKRIGKRSEEG